MPMLKKVIQSAHVEKKIKQELYKFLSNYRATSHSSTGVTPAETLFGRKINVKLPEAPTIPYSHSRHAHLDTHMRKHDFLMKKKMKNYAEAKRTVSTTDIQVGDTVLVRQPKKNKLTPYYNPNPMQVTAKKGPMLTAKQPGGTRITRNSVSVFSFSFSLR